MQKNGWKKKRMKYGAMKSMSNILDVFYKENKRLNSISRINPSINNKNGLNRKLVALESKSELQWISEHVKEPKILYNILK